MMRKQLTKRGLSLAVAFLMALTFIIPGMPAAAAGNLTATAQTATDAPLESNNLSDIQVFLTHSGLTDSPTSATIQYTGSGGLICSGKVTVSAFDSSSTDPLTYTFIIPADKIFYSGTGSSVGLSLNVTYDTDPSKIYSTTASLRAEPDPEPEPVVPDSLFKIKEDTAIPAADPGKETLLAYPLVSDRRIFGDVEIEADLPAGIYFTVAAPNQKMDFRRESEQNYELKVFVNQDAAPGIYPINLKLKYRYYGSDAEEDITTYVKVTDASAPQAVTKLTVTGYSSDPETVKAGSDFNLSVRVRNDGDTTCKDVRVALGDSSISTSAFTLDGILDYQMIPALKAGEEKLVTFALCSNPDMTSGNYQLDALVSCGGKEFSTRMFIPVAGKSEKADGSSGMESFPQLIIDSYSYGEEGTASVVGGKVFTLSASIRNTGKIPVKNVKITISSANDAEIGGAFSPANSSNTFYVESIPAGATISQSIDLLPKADAKPKSYGVDYTFSYEAIVDDTLKSDTISQTIAIPLTQPDRFEVGELMMYGPVYFGQPLGGYLTYVNKGKTTIYNLSMKVEGENFTTGESEVYIGNVESGTSDGYDITINPNGPGMVNGTVTFVYEDANGDTKEVVKTFESEVMEFIEPEMPDGPGEIMPDMQVDGEDGMPHWVWIVIAAAGTAVVIVLAVVIRKTVKKKKQAALDAEDDFDDENTGDQA